MRTPEEILADIIREATIKGRHAGLEEAAKVVEPHQGEYGFDLRTNLAAAIRALKDKA